jgi:dolichol kinase
MLTIEEIIYALILLTWVNIVVLIITKKLYNYMIKKGYKHNVAIYFNRKVIHVLAGGLVAVLVPFLFKSFILPLALGFLFAVFTYIPHKTGKLMYWFQDPENYYEVNFCVVWGVMITIGWIIFGKPEIAIIPVLFMAFGDAITGFVRNMMFKRRTKSWWGNLAMAGVSIPIGYTIGIAGIVAAVFASIIEHYEFKYIDDNITVPLVSFIIIYVFMNFSFL